MRCMPLPRVRLERKWTPVKRLRPVLELPVEQQRERCRPWRCFIFFARHDDWTRGGFYGVGHMRVLFGVSRGSISNVFYHVAGSLHRALKALRPCLIQWPDPAFRAATKGLINGFPEVAVFVDVSKQRAYRPGDPFLQEFIYDGHHHFHAYTVLFWCDVFGRCVRLDFTLKGSMHDREIYNNTAVGQNPEQFFTRDALGNFTERVMGDSGPQGHGPMEAPHKGNQAANFTGRGARNRDIRKQ